MAYTTPSIQHNILTDRLVNIVVGSQDWQHWLDEPSHTAFRYVEGEQRFTARREYRQSGWYWYAYRRHNGTLRKVYLGKTPELTLERLQATAEVLSDHEVTIGGVGANSTFTLDSSTDQAVKAAFAVAGEQSQLGELLASKLHIPSLHPRLVLRPRLTNTLSQGSTEHKLTLITAPAGSGKTTLLCEWLHSFAGGDHACHVAWVALDEGDNDPARFWRYCFAALEHAHTGPGALASDALHAVPPTPIEAILTGLIGNLSLLPDAGLLILDDYHLIHDQSIHEALAFLLDHLPEQWRIVIASRTVPPLPLSRLRTQGQLYEIDVSNLRFSLEEATIFLTQVMGLPLAETDIRALEARTEGWAAGLQLAALALQHDESGVAIGAINHHYMIDYLVEEVLLRQPDDIQDFLLATSILERLHGSLCNALTGRTDSNFLLERLLAANLFIIPLDEDHNWYRYHHLFADALRCYLKRTQPQRLPELHGCAAMWYEQHGQLHEAINHALAAEDAPLAGRLIEDHGLTMFRTGETATLKSWLNTLPCEVKNTRPRLLTLESAADISIGQLDLAEAHIHNAKYALHLLTEQVKDATDPHRAGYIEQAIAEMAVTEAVLAAFRGKVSHALELSRKALSLLPADDTFMRSVIAASLATAHALNGNITEANAALEEAKAMSRAANNTHVLLSSIGARAYLLTEQGHLHAAAETYRQCLQLATQSNGREYPAASIAYIGLGELHYQWNELDTSARYLEHGITLGKLWGDVLLHARAYAIWARVVAIQGNLERALQITDDMQEQGLRYDVPRAVIWAGATRARIWLLQGNIDAAHEWEHAANLPLDVPLTYMNEYEYLSLVRVLIARGVPDEALRLLARLQQLTQFEGRSRSTIETLVLQALALDRQGETTQTMHLLAQVLALAEPDGYIRVFADEGTPVVSLLLRLIEACRKRGSLNRRQSVSPGFSVGYIARLLDALGTCVVLPTTRGAVQNANTLLLDPLSERELYVLQRIAAGLSNRQVADELIVAPSTVKWHVKHIYQKLQAHNRMQVVAKARELHLLN